MAERDREQARHPRPDASVPGAGRSEPAGDHGVSVPRRFERAAVELFSVTGKKAQAAAREAGLSPSSIPTILAIGDDRPGLGSEITEAIAGVGINLSFMVAQVIGRKYSCIYGFETQEDARVGAALIKKASRPRKK